MEYNSEDTCNEILFLGEWCKTYPHTKNPKVKSETLDYHWDDRNKLENDFFYLENLYKKVLISLSNKLNFIHKKNYDSSFWEITIGYWLYNFLHVVFDRWEVLSKLDSSKEYFLNHIDYNLDKLMVNTTYDSINNFIEDYWNSYIFREILKHRYSINCYQKPQIKKVKEKRINKKNSSTKSNLFLSIFSLLSKKNTSVILDVKLSFYDMIILFFKTNSLYFPTKTYIDIEESAYDEKKRNWELKFNSSNEFETFLSKKISYHIPKVFIEGFDNILIELNKSLLPKSPKNILSSNSFFTNDFFSFYMALSKMNGTKILTWQHGGFFGIGKFSVYENYQISVSDKFFSWGWSNKNKNVIPLGYFKKFNGENKTFKSKESILYVNTMYPRYSYNIYSTYISSQNIKYFDSQFNFFKNLDKTIFSKMVIKLPNYDYGWNIKARFRDSFPDINIFNGNKSALNLINTAKITVCSYNGTFFLESLAKNVPTIIFLNKEYFELNKESIPMFKILKKHFIFHETSLSAANHLNLIYDKVDEWWYEENLQKSLKEFVYLYCRSYKTDKLISSLNE